MFEFNIYDFHYIIKHDDLGEAYRVPEQEVWMTFPFSVDMERLKIDAIRGDVLLEPDGDDYKYIQCTKVHLSDGSYVYAKVQYDTFKKNYNNYLESLPKG